MGADGVLRPPGPAEHARQARRLDLTDGPGRALLWRRRVGADGSSISDYELWHDWLLSRPQGLEAVSEQPSIVPGIARGAEHGARQCTVETLPEEIALAASQTRVSNS